MLTTEEAGEAASATELLLEHVTKLLTYADVC
jgi:hypothetical protein